MGKKNVDNVLEIMETYKESVYSLAEKEDYLKWKITSFLGDKSFDNYDCGIKARGKRNDD